MGQTHKIVEAASVPLPWRSWSSHRGAQTHFVRGFAGPSHPRAPEGTLLGETWHIGETSKDMELDAWRCRMEKGEVGRVEVLEVSTTTVRAWVLG